MSPGPVVSSGERIALVSWAPSSLIDDNVTVPLGTQGTVTGYHPGVDQVWVD